MALINCPECGTQVSDRAPACPNCAYPLRSGGSGAPASSSPSQMRDERAQVIEQTSKKWKGHQLLGAALLVIGTVTCFGGAAEEGGGGTTVTVGTIMATVGLLWFIVARFGAWWYHK